MVVIWMHEQRSQFSRAKSIHRIGKEPNLLKLKDPVTVVGDIHGQYYDFVKMLDVGGDPENTK